MQAQSSQRHTERSSNVVLVTPNYGSLRGWCPQQSHPESSFPYLDELSSSDKAHNPKQSLHYTNQTCTSLAVPVAKQTSLQNLSNLLCLTNTSSEPLGCSTTQMLRKAVASQRISVVLYRGLLNSEYRWDQGSWGLGFVASYNKVPAFLQGAQWKYEAAGFSIVLKIIYIYIYIYIYILFLY